MLVEKNGFFQISTGDLLRSAIKAGTKLGNDAKGFMDKGELVPDSVVIGMVDEVLIENLKNGKKSFIFDGFPRTVAQAQSLKEILSKNGLKADSVVFIGVDSNGLVKRLTGRRVCQTCGSVYHIENNPSKVSGVCDKCGGQLILRSDDREEVILSRLKTYQEVADLLRNFYIGDGIVKEVNGDQAVEVVYKSIVSSAGL
jgi:adenylate kinase